MNSLVLLAVAIACFVIAYIVYGGWLVKKWGIDNSKKTPAHTKYDNVDYVPSDAKILLGHHFSSIAGAGPITGPILAAVFGWLPAYLWIVLGSIFAGGVHDFGALFASVRHEGKGIGEIIKTNIGKKGKICFNIFAYATLILVVAAFADICAGTFAFDSAKQEVLTGARAGTASIFFIVLAVIFGFLVYRKNVNLALATVVGVVLLFLCIWLGYLFPIIKLTKMQWNIVLLVYITLASILPVWILLQPRDYLCSFLLYAMLAGAFIGIILSHPEMQIDTFAGFKVGGNTLFPFLFVTIACGAISGFHSLVSSGTTSKQLNYEKDCRMIGYGAMLLEGVVAVIALISVGYIAKSSGTPAQIFAGGVANFMSKFGVPVEVGKVFVILAFSAFALTSLDTATRIGRYTFQEFFSDAKDSPVKKFFTSKYTSTLITVALSALLLSYGYSKIWPIFGSANQLLGALALLAVSAWLAKSKKKNIMTIIPMVFMFAVTLVALILLIYKNVFVSQTQLTIGIIAIVLFILAVYIAAQGIIALVKINKENQADMKKVKKA